ncbi:isoniazid response ATPase/transcriptional regulator IniR [Mycobacterium sp. CVI_P3]|uniref:Isoniazid response ATPase/transcriptional regulator IniR n=1 Tax=Mycobacterium pinniadriaticum TaxID=2994102 RepID=A0ABT3SM98_9MYCO|nr:isoniazid response ATPase/transcriptional regulator IniR [Mycobacterium pinniadriaticum]MCX2933859.1 isoniazid response ATPase/transcriptional regulator IniR [Mycobacterium pinniadriaticum]MCX2940288.1 isoniazid response ATPase/transcriptional regulator IniR [Mycobacterium pinniadriaticum]
MADPIPVQSLSPTATDAVSALGSAPVKLVVTGGIGTGKSAVLVAARDTLRETGVAVLTRPPAPGDPSEAAVVVDDAHLLAGAELARLTELAGDPSSTVVVAVQPRDHDENLQALITAIERERPRVTLAPMTSGDLSRLMTDPSGHPPRTELVSNVLAATAGIPFLVDAALSSARPNSAEAIAQAAEFALIDRLRRLSEPELDALLIATLSRDLGATDLAAALDIPPEEARLLIDRARASGLVEPVHSPHFLRSVHRAAAQILGNARHHDIETALLRSQIAMSTLSGDLALRLAEHGVRDEQLADVLRQQAGAGRADPALYRAAVDAGATELRARLADALALAGECSAAASEADDLLASDDPAERAAAVRIAASVAMQNGNAAQAADLFTWLGPYPDAAVSAAATIALTATGDAAGAERALAVQSTGPPTAAARAARSLAEGLLSTLQTPYSTAAVKLGAAMATDCSTDQVLPDSPAALVALAALHGGDPVRARSVIARAVRTDRDNEDTGYAHRHRLLLGWVKMQDGHLAAAASDIAGIDGSLRRDALWAAALRTALARRGGDTGALQKHWYAAMEVLVEYSVDLFSLLPLGELWVASARIGQQDRLAPALEQAFGVLESLGDPLTWSVPLRWAGVHAGILAGDPAAVAPHGQALTAAAPHSPFAKALAVAGRTWLRVLAGQVDADEVGAAARGLSQFGLTADGTRLAGQAALQTSDPKVSGLMLQVARDLKLSVGESAGDDGQPPAAELAGAGSAGNRPMASPLSDREREVAELLLLGMPYRDIGGQLFISAKTVEHHVARIRRRLGAESRSEMLSMLRAILSPDESASGTH